MIQENVDWGIALKAGKATCRLRVIVFIRHFTYLLTRCPSSVIIAP